MCAVRTNSGMVSNLIKRVVTNNEDQVTERYYEYVTENSVIKHGAYLLEDSITRMPLIEVTYKLGRKTGIAHTYFDNVCKTDRKKRVKSLINFRADKLSGHCSTYYETGVMRSVVHFIANKPTGQGVVFNENKTIKFICKFRCCGGKVEIFDCENNIPNETARKLTQIETTKFVKKWFNFNL
ncbi:MAG: hypothetical protein ACRCX2_28110 [Paraclostridium sp.]